MGNSGNGKKWEKVNGYSISKIIPFSAIEITVYVIRRSFESGIRKWSR